MTWSLRQTPGEQPVRERIEALREAARGLDSGRQQIEQRLVARSLTCPQLILHPFS